MPSKPKILIIEDNADLLAALEHLLSEDYLVATAARGGDGVALATSFRPDIVLLDLQLPDMDGREVCRHIKRHANVPVLVLSATIAGDAADTLREVGSDAFLPKPADIETIRAKLTELLGTATGAAE